MPDAPEESARGLLWRLEDYPQVRDSRTVAAAGMPSLALLGAAPNALACRSWQFTALEFFRARIPTSVSMVVVSAPPVWTIWPRRGMPVTPAP